MKKLKAKVGTYQKDGQEKGRYVDVGVINQGNNGEYMLLSPDVNLAGVLIKQNNMLASQGKQPRDSVMVSILDDTQQSQHHPQSPQHNMQQTKTFPNRVKTYGHGNFYPKSIDC